MIGDLRSRLGLYSARQSSDDIGGAVTSWQLDRIVWGHIAPQSISERGAHGRLSVTQSYKITIRYMPGFPERARLIWGARTLRVITASDPDNRGERLHLICEEERL
ncbi:phage head closure protein [Robiginitomaculum antarcticum]|uniref:phage head closure protein n=1 Tax=Robiginitomaculum antarcticum TaxID=437507 RepID=UPI0003817FC7|nr:phage head closure protein [Robiginitomaculum antarcticum]